MAQLSKRRTRGKFSARRHNVFHQPPCTVPRSASLPADVRLE
jgi:hypothetical protein